MFERGNMLPDCRFEVLAYGKTDVLPAGVTQDVAEELHAPTTFLSKVDRVSGPIHLSLSTWQSFKSNHRSFRLGSVVFDIGAKCGVTTAITKLAQFFESSLSSKANGQ